MRNLLIVSTLLLLVVGVGSCSSTKSVQKTEAQKAKAEQVAKAVADRAFEVDVELMHPMRGRSISVVSSYSVKIAGDSIYSHLPYFGEARNLPYGGGEGLRFNSTIEKYEQSLSKKGAHQIRFETRSKEDTFTFFITIFENGGATINVNSLNRQAISYSGKLVEEETKSKGD